MSEIYNQSLRSIAVNSMTGTAVAHSVLEGEHVICFCCGFDGRNLDDWLQLSVDHVHLRSADWEDTLANAVTAWKFCNSGISLMKFSRKASRDEIRASKREKVAQFRKVSCEWRLAR